MYLISKSQIQSYADCLQFENQGGGGKKKAKDKKKAKCKSFTFFNLPANSQESTPSGKVQLTLVAFPQEGFSAAVVLTSQTGNCKNRYFFYINGYIYKKQ